MVPLNVQPIEKKDDGDGSELDVVDIWATMQGEGPFAGTPAVFVRTAGCNLQCIACFHANTSIRMGDFSIKQISEIRVGDQVLSYNEEEQRFVKKSVTAVMSRKTKLIYRVQTGQQKTFVTGNHPFLVRDKGWVEAKNLVVGDRILHLSTSEKMRLHNPMKRSEVVERVKATQKLRKEADPSWGQLSDEARDRVSEIARQRMLTDNPMKNPAVALKGFLNRKDRGKMTNAEQFVARLAEDFGLRFVGDGSLVVGYKVPDFIFEGTKKLVEVWDQEQTEYMKRDKKWMQQRREIFESAGYEVLFLPVQPLPLHDRVGSRKTFKRIQRDKEVVRVKRLLTEYARNGSVVTSIHKISAGRNPKAWTALAGSLNVALTVYNFEVKGTHTYLANGMIVHNCDTDYTTNRTKKSIDQILAEIDEARQGYRISLIVLTGGEPLRQNLSQFIARANPRFRIQIETNGTLYQPLPRNVSVVCSPKTPKIHPQLERDSIDAFKFILQAGFVDPVDGLPTSSLGGSVPPARPMVRGYADNIYVQPLDEQDEQANEANRKAAVASCMRFGYKLSLQNHKLLGLK